MVHDVHPLVGSPDHRVMPRPDQGLAITFQDGGSIGIPWILIRPQRILGNSEPDAVLSRFPPSAAVEQVIAVIVAHHERPFHRMPRIPDTAVPGPVPFEDLPVPCRPQDRSYRT